MFKSIDVIKIYKEYHTNFQNGSVIITKILANKESERTFETNCSLGRCKLSSSCGKRVAKDMPIQEICLGVCILFQD